MGRPALLARSLLISIARSLAALLAMPAFSLLAPPLALAATAAQGVAPVPQLDVKFSCSTEREEDATIDGGRRLYADSGEMHLRGAAIDGFRWESSLFRSTHGFDCSIDDSDGLQAELLVHDDDFVDGWRVRPHDGRLARARRGYDADHGVQCTIRLLRRGDALEIVPSCPALCGSRENFSALTVDLKTGQCTYQH